MLIIWAISIIQRYIILWGINEDEFFIFSLPLTHPRSTLPLPLQIDEYNGLVFVFVFISGCWWLWPHSFTSTTSRRPCFYPIVLPTYLPTPFLLLCVHWCQGRGNRWGTLFDSYLTRVRVSVHLLPCLLSFSYYYFSSKQYQRNLLVTKMHNIHMGSVSWFIYLVWRRLQPSNLP